MRKVLWLIFSFFFIFAVSPVFAVRIVELYQAVVPVATQSPDELKQVLPQGLAQVLIKVSGNPHVMENGKIKSRLNSADKLLLEYGYKPAPADSAKPYLLQMDFDSKGINQLLGEAAVPIWGQSRPLLLVWMDYETSGHAPEIISNDSATGLTTILKQSADRRGVPVIFPMLDMTDINQVKVTDIAEMNLPVVMNASPRYSSDGVLIGKITQSASGYISQWKLQMGDEQWSFAAAGKTSTEMFDLLANHVADTLASRYATTLSGGVQPHFTIIVNNVAQAEDYTNLMGYIGHLTQVLDVNVAEVSGSTVELTVGLRGSVESFMQAVALSKKLHLVATDTANHVLTYEWNH